ncbi:MAG: hypothetical protein JWP78_326 [Mucilaginibacter sp.]|nr:hypothetical protein [Mucilaginibacter sp.]
MLIHYCHIVNIMLTTELLRIGRDFDQNTALYCSQKENDKPAGPQIITVLQLFDLPGPDQPLLSAGLILNSRRPFSLLFQLLIGYLAELLKRLLNYYIQK